MENSSWVTYPLFGYWPSRDIEVIFDPETHQWTLTGAYRYDVPAKLPYETVVEGFRNSGPVRTSWPQRTFDTTKEWACKEGEWKLDLSYNPSAGAYEVQKAELPDANPGWRSTRKDDFARWLQGGYPEPRPSSDALNALHLVVEVPEPTKLALKPNYMYGKNDLAAEVTPRGVSVRNDDHGAGGVVEQWTLQFGAPYEQLLKVGKYGGAYDPEILRGYSGPLIVVKHGVLDAGKQASEWSCGPGEFVVWEIEVKEQKVVRLAIDFIADSEYGRSATPKRDARCIVRGSLRFHSLLQLSVPNLGAAAASYRLTEPAPAGFRGMKFVPLPKGTFYMAWNGTKGSAKKTEIKEDFEIAIYTVTQGQWQELMGNNPSWFSRQGGGREAVKVVKDEELKQFPVENVSQNDLREFIKKLNEKEKSKGYVYRLPTEEEWEYACRGGATTEEECSYHFYFEKPTNDLSSKQANFDGRKPFGKGEEGPHLDRTAKVGSYAPNKIGLYDMHGNVWQWIKREVARGGDWRSPASSCQAASRGRFGWPGPRFDNVGFRLARVPVRKQAIETRAKVMRSHSYLWGAPVLAPPLHPPHGRQIDFIFHCFDFSKTAMVDSYGSMRFNSRFEPKIPSLPRKE
jgi:formylglycine-generating enzyme required for sulfatase activity